MTSGIEKYIDKERGVLVVSKPSCLCQILQRNEVVETSVFGGPVMTPDRTDAMAAKLTALFPSMNAMAIAEICNTVLAEGWSIQRATYAFEKIKHHEYPFFAPGKFLQMDKKITFGRSEFALRRQLKFTITQNDIVIVKLARTYTDKDGVEKQDFFRAYAYKDEAEDVMPDRIIGRWNDREHVFEFSGENFFDHTIEKRQGAFKQSLYEQCDAPPEYHGIYPIDFIRRFYEYWSQVIPPGDMLLFESRISFNLETTLEGMYKKYQQQLNQQNNEQENETNR